MVVLPDILPCLVTTGCAIDELAPPAGPFSLFTLTRLEILSPKFWCPATPLSLAPCPMSPSPCLLALPSFSASQFGETPLHVAAALGHAHVASLLLATPDIGPTLMGMLRGGRANALLSTLGMLENPALCMEPCVWSTARLVSPSASTLALSRLPGSLHADRPLEIELACKGYDSSGSASTASVASWLSAHARLSVEIGGQPLSAPVSVRPSGGGWMARALIHPGAWCNAFSVSVVSLVVAGRPLPCDCLPATLFRDSLQGP